MAGARHHSGPDATPDGSAHTDADRGAGNPDREADMDADFCPDPDWCPAAPDPHGHRTDDTYFYRPANTDFAGPGVDTLPDPVQLQPAAGRMPDGALGAGTGARGDGTGRDGLR